MTVSSATQGPCILVRPNWATSFIRYINQNTIHSSCVSYLYSRVANALQRLFVVCLNALAGLSFTKEIRADRPACCQIRRLHCLPAFRILWLWIYLNVQQPFSHCKWRIRMRWPSPVISSKVEPQTFKRSHRIQFDGCSGPGGYPFILKVANFKQ